jgi:hypothetical protein
MHTAATLWARLPAGGWQVGFWTDASGRTLIDIADPSGALAYRLASARRAAPSIDAGWTGCGSSPDGDAQNWALAIGHAPAGQSHIVSFTRHTPAAPHDRVTLPPHASSGLWTVHNGLWVAAATGCYTHVQLTTQSTTRLHPLHQAMNQPANRPLWRAEKTQKES